MDNEKMLNRELTEIPCRVRLEGSVAGTAVATNTPAATMLHAEGKKVRARD